MIQRKQTIFLLLAFVLTMVCLSTKIGEYSAEGMVMGKVYNLWVTDASGNRHFTTWPLMAILMVSGIIALLTIFMYQKRLVQSKLCAVCAFLMVAWYIAYVVLTGEGISLCVSAVLPAICAILYVIARRAILADEKLVRSMDRIR